MRRRPASRRLPPAGWSGRNFKESSTPFGSRTFRLATKRRHSLGYLEFGYCCGVTSTKISSTGPEANTPYRVAITPIGANFEAAPFPVSDEVGNDTYVASTANGGSSWGAGYAEAEYNPAIGGGK